MNIFIGAAFLAGLPPVACALGGVLITLQIVVITTHFCLASWMVEQLQRAGPLAPPTRRRRRELVAGGAALVDVRQPEEFQQEHLYGAVNIPLSELSARSGELTGQTVVLYCRSGLRSQEARCLLESCGCQDVHDLGAMARWCA